MTPVSIFIREKPPVVVIFAGGCYNIVMTKDQSRHKLSNAIMRGRIMRPDFCEGCGDFCKPQGHHDDYQKPLEVRWLCVNCHNDFHHPLRHSRNRSQKHLAKLVTLEFAFS